MREAACLSRRWAGDRTSRHEVTGKVLALPPRLPRAFGDRLPSGVLGSADSASPSREVAGGARAGRSASRQERKALRRPTAQGRRRLPTSGGGRQTKGVRGIQGRHLQMALRALSPGAWRLLPTSRVVTCPTRRPEARPMTQERRPQTKGTAAKAPHLWNSAHTCAVQTRGRLPIQPWALLPHVPGAPV